MLEYPFPTLVNVCRTFLSLTPHSWNNELFFISMNGHMIKFQFFENERNFQCHTNSLGTYVSSISHYMRAYFNHEALVDGRDFVLPEDASYLNVSYFTCIHSLSY